MPKQVASEKKLLQCVVVQVLSIY